MKSAISYFLPLLLFLAGCSLFKSPQTGSLFEFEYEDQVYEIAGFTSEDGESVNMLIQRDPETDEVYFRVMDENQTGVLDRVITGEISLEEANRIYQAGIRIAQQQDQYKSIERDRTYETETDDFRLIVESYMNREDSPFNRFIIYDLNWNLLGVYFDEGSDATLNRIQEQESEIDITTAQELYMQAIDRASEDNKLEKNSDSQVIISKDAKALIPRPEEISR